MSKTVTAVVLSILVFAARSDAAETIDGTVRDAQGTMRETISRGEGRSPNFIEDRLDNDSIARLQELKDQLKEKKD